MGVIQVKLSVEGVMSKPTEKESISPDGLSKLIEKEACDEEVCFITEEMEAQALERGDTSYTDPPMFISRVIKEDKELI